MRITIDDFSDIEEMEIKHFEDSIRIELPKKKSAADITKALKVVAQQLTKEFYKVNNSEGTKVDE